MIELVQASKLMGKKEILNSCNFLFEEGKKYVISGSSGVGKTTLLNIIAGYEKLDFGDMKIADEKSYQYLFQETLLFSNLSLKENMIIKYLSKKEGKDVFLDKEIKKALSAFDIYDLMHKKVYELSGGEKRRLELAQIFLFMPDILLLDEPTIGLDYENKIKLIELIDHIFKCTTTLIVSHEDKNLFEDYIYLRLERGKIIYE